MKIMYKYTVTITFGEVATSHIGMNEHGNILNNGLTYEDLLNAQNKFNNLGYETELINLKCLLSLQTIKDKCDDMKLSSFLDNDENSEPAYILIIRNGLDCILKKKNLTVNDMYLEHENLKHDKKYYCNRKNKVLNKIARYNLAFGNESIEPNYESNQGRIIGWNDILCTKLIRKKLHKFFGSKAKKLNAEGNYYYSSLSGIGFHGDVERRIVIGARLGNTMNLVFKWFLKSKPLSDPLILHLNNGDLYAMSSKATGYDWKKRNIPTLRHSAGSSKYTKI